MSKQVTRYNRIGVAGRRADGGTRTDPFLESIVVPVSLVASTSTQDSGIALPANCSVVDVVINVITASTSGTTEAIDVGVVGNPDALIDGGATDATGFVGPTGGGGEISPRVFAGENVAYAFGAADIDAFSGEIVITVIGSD